MVSLPVVTGINASTGTSVTLTIIGQALATHQVYYTVLPTSILVGGTSWSVGASRVGNGSLTQSGLTNGRRYTFVVISTLLTESSLPSLPISLQVFDDHTSVIEKCAVELEAKLLELILVGIATHVQRPCRTKLLKTPPSYGIVLAQDNDPEEVPEEQPDGSKQWSQVWSVECYIKNDENSTIPIDTLVNNFRAEVEKKLREDPNLSGYAVDTRIRSPEGFVTDGGYEGVTVNVEVLLRHDEDDPFVIR